MFIFKAPFVTFSRPSNVAHLFTNCIGLFLVKSGKNKGKPKLGNNSVNAVQKKG